jgi:hypothetical protein
VSKKIAEISPYSEQDEGSDLHAVSRKRTEIPLYSEQDERRYFFMP